HDAAVREILAPTGNIPPGLVVPQVRARNLGTLREPVALSFRIIPSSYSRTLVFGNGLPLGADTLVSFPAWNAVAGEYLARCSVYLAREQVRVNDTLSQPFLVSGQVAAGWFAKTNVPTNPRGKTVKDGGALAYGDDFVYALRGNGTCDFMRYSPASNAWEVRESLPAVGSSGRVKTVKKGGALAYGNGVYAVKGNNSLEFWFHDPVTGHWTQRADVLAGSRTIKEGAGLAAVTSGGSTQVYLLKGSGTTEFMRYNVAGGQWEMMAQAPTGISGKPYKTGSCIAWDGDNRIYCLKGTQNEFYAYDIAANSWQTLASLPLTGSAGRKKAKDGAALTWLPGRVYCLKGANTQEFWCYEPAGTGWTEKEAMPLGQSGKRVKNGGALTATEDLIYAFKGNSTLEFWMYQPAVFNGPLPTSSGGMSRSASIKREVVALRAVPNPCPGWTLVSYTLPFPGSYRLKLYDINGVPVAELAAGRRAAGTYLLPAALGSLSRGVYLLRLETAAAATSQKLVIE
ncbi:MAG: T9SS type A sorting domain-containing protein, partial [candidate division WOR-3 bacterium]